MQDVKKEFKFIKEIYNNLGLDKLPQWGEEEFPTLPDYQQLLLFQYSKAQTLSKKIEELGKTKLSVSHGSRNSIQRNSIAPSKDELKKFLEVLDAKLPVYSVLYEKTGSDNIDFYTDISDFKSIKSPILKEILEEEVKKALFFKLDSFLKEKSIEQCTQENLEELKTILEQYKSHELEGVVLSIIKSKHASIRDGNILFFMKCCMESVLNKITELRMAPSTFLNEQDNEDFIALTTRLGSQDALFGRKLGTIEAIKIQFSSFMEKFDKKINDQFARLEEKLNDLLALEIDEKTIQIQDLIKLKNDLKDPKLDLLKKGKKRRVARIDLVNNAIAQKKAELKGVKTASDLLILKEEIQQELTNETQLEDDVQDILNYLNALVRTLSLKKTFDLKALQNVQEDLSNLSSFKEAGEPLRKEINALSSSINSAIQQIENNYANPDLVEQGLSVLPGLKGKMDQMISRANYLKSIDELPKRFASIVQPISGVDREEFKNAQQVFNELMTDASLLLSEGKQTDEIVFKMDKLTRIWELKQLIGKYSEIVQLSNAMTGLLPRGEKGSLSRWKESLVDVQRDIKNLNSDLIQDKNIEGQYKHLLNISRELDDLSKELNEVIAQEKQGFLVTLVEEVNKRFNALEAIKEDVGKFKQLKAFGVYLSRKIQDVQNAILTVKGKIEEKNFDVRSVVYEVAALKKQSDRILVAMESFKSYEQKLDVLDIRFELAMQSIPNSLEKHRNEERRTKLFEEAKHLVSEGFDLEAKLSEITKLVEVVEKAAKVAALIELQRKIHTALEQINALAWLLPETEERKEVFKNLEEELRNYGVAITQRGDNLKHGISVENDQISEISTQITAFPAFHEFMTKTREEIVTVFEENKKNLLKKVNEAQEKLGTYGGSVYQSEKDEYFNALADIRYAIENIQLLKEDNSLDLSKIAKLHELGKKYHESELKCKEELISLYREIKESGLIDKRHNEARKIFDPESHIFEELDTKKSNLDNAFKTIGESLLVLHPEVPHDNQRAPQRLSTNPFDDSRSLNPFDDDVLDSTNPFNDEVAYNSFDEIEEPQNLPIEEIDVFALFDKYQEYQTNKDSYDQQYSEALKGVYYPAGYSQTFMDYLSEVQIVFFNKTKEQLISQDQSDLMGSCLNELSELEKVQPQSLDIDHVNAFQMVKARLMQIQIEIQDLISNKQTEEIRNGLGEGSDPYKALKSKLDQLTDQRDKAKKALIKPTKNWFETTEAKIAAMQVCLDTINKSQKLSTIQGAVETLKNNSIIDKRRGSGFGRVDSRDFVDAFAAAMEVEVAKAGDLSGIAKSAKMRQERGEMIQKYIQPFEAKLKTLQNQLSEIPVALRESNVNPFDEEVSVWNQQREEVLAKIEAFNEKIDLFIDEGKGNTLIKEYTQLLVEVNQFNKDVQKAAEAKVKAENKQMIENLKLQYQALELPDGYEKVEHAMAKQALNEIKRLISESSGFVEKREEIENQKTLLEGQFDIFEAEKNKIQEALDRVNAPIPQKILNVLEEGFEGGKEVVGGIVNDIEQTAKKGGNALDNFFKGIGKGVEKIKDVIVDKGDDLIQGVGGIFSPKNKRMSSNPNIFLSSQNQSNSNYDLRDLEQRMTPTQKRWVNKHFQNFEKEVSKMIFDGYEDGTNPFKKQAKNALKSFYDTQIANFERNPNDTTELRAKLTRDCETCKEFINKAFESDEEQKKNIIQAAVVARWTYLLDNPKNWDENEFKKDMTEKAFYTGYFFKGYSSGGKTLEESMRSVTASGSDPENKTTIGNVGETIRNAPVIHEVAELIDKGVDKAKEIPGLGLGVKGVCMLGNVITGAIAKIEFEKPSVDMTILNQPIQLGWHGTLAETFSQKNKSLEESVKEYGDYKFLKGGSQSYRNNFGNR